MDNLSNGRIIGIDVSRDCWTFIASPMGIVAECPTLRPVTLL